MSIQEYSKKIIELIDEIKLYQTYKNRLDASIISLNNQFRERKISEKAYKENLKRLLKDKTKDEWNTYFNSYIKQLLDQISSLNSKIYEEFSEQELKIPLPLRVSTKSPRSYKLLKQEVKESKEEIKQIPLPEIVSINKKTKLKYLNELNINKADIQNFLRSQKIKGTKISPKIKYTVYKSNFFAKISNVLFDRLSVFLIKKYPNMFKSLFNSLRIANIKLLSRTYVSIMLFSSFLALPLVALFSYLFLNDIIKSVLLGILGFFATFFFIYIYPYTLINSKKRGIKNDLVFAVIHMSAIAGSGTQPIKIFKLLVDSGEYKNLESEIKKVLNYINLFGYNLSTALREVASTTPSPELKELLSGMVSTIETGGDIKDYLKEKTEDMLNNYKIEQKKHTILIATYSDVYVGIMIAAPLLIIITLAILDKIASTIGNVSIATISAVGVYFLIPFVNIVFILFLNITQPEI